MITSLFGLEISADDAEQFVNNADDYAVAFWRGYEKLAEEAAKHDGESIDAYIEKAMRGDASAAWIVSAWFFIFSPYAGSASNFYVNGDRILNALNNSPEHKFYMGKFVIRKPSVELYAELTGTPHQDDYFSHCAFYCVMNPAEDHSAYARMDKTLIC